MTPLNPPVAQSWLETSDAVLRGLNHEFSNRLSLARLAPQLSAMLVADEGDLKKLAEDGGNTEELFQLLRLYRLMVFGNSEPAEPILMSDVVPDAIALFKHHTTFRDIDVRTSAPDTTPPVLMNPAALAQAVLLLLSAAARRVRAQPHDAGELTLGFAADADAVRLSIIAGPVANDEPAAEPPELPALRYLIRDAEGTVDVTPGGVTMSIGTLVRLRRREKQG